MPSPTIDAIASTLAAWAPPGSAQSYDNVGLQVGDAMRSVERALIALDCTSDVIDEARAQNAQLIITHHPLLFKPLKAVTAGAGPSGLALRLAEAGIALYSIHTNLDAAREGVSFMLARQLGLEEVDYMEGLPEALYKLVTFVPSPQADDVHEALAMAGAGQIGRYEACAFRSQGVGYFRPGEDADPHVGAAGGPMETVEEIRLEMEVPRWARGRILEALRSAHPYEEVAYDLYPVDQSYRDAGLGTVGHLAKAEPLETFLGRVARALDAESLRYAGDPDAMIRRVAVCGGAGSSFVGRALKAGADAYVTSDVSYHTFFDVLDARGRPQVAFVDAGHYETEAAAEDLLLEHLQDAFPSVTWRRTATRTSPVRTFVR